MALSHTWGGGQPLTTAKATLPSRMKSIQLSDLPATFRDAVVITRSLGCRYPWIDSLCIIQDSSEDWQEESAKMRHVYRGSTLTISALYSANSDAGIFVPRKPTMYVEVAPEKALGHGPIYVTPDLGSWNKVFGRSVLNTRGWTLQDRLLSPRLLHFSEDELLWECLTCVEREGTRVPVAKDGPNYMETQYSGPEIHVNMPPQDFSKTPALLGFLNEWAAANKDPFTVWYKAVGSFSSRDLTYGKHKLPALSGLAAEMRLQTKATYLAGLWEQDLLNGLCWRLYPGSDASAVNRLSKYRGPSWSWACLDGKVEFCEPPVGIGTEQLFASVLGGRYHSSTLDGDMGPTILDSTVCTLGLDPLGEVTSASIQLKCHGLRALMIRDPSFKPFRKHHRVILGVGRRMFPYGSWLFEAEEIGFKGVVDSVDDLGLSQCLFIPLARRTVDALDHAIALLIAPVAGSSGTFRRIGICWMHEQVAVVLFRGCTGKSTITIV